MISLYIKIRKIKIKIIDNHVNYENFPLQDLKF
jgi:hypothetical protein